MQLEISLSLHMKFICNPSILLPAATKLGQVIFSQACVKNSVHGGVSASGHAGIHPPGPGTPPTRHPPDQAPHPPDQAPPRDQARPSPRTRHPPDQADPPGVAAPPLGKQTAACGQRAAGTHPTGIHSCLKMVLIDFMEK